jgi:hypothetical protein
MITKIEIDSQDVKKLILDHIKSKGNPDVKLEDIKIVTQSTQNYKAEWESAVFKAEITIIS